jgi:acyl dehydratase
MIAVSQAKRMDSPLFFEDIQVGQVWNSPRRTVTEADVISFASMTGDYNPLHVDYDYASKSHYRQPIAHGLLGLSWVAGLGSYFPSVNTLAFLAVRDWEFHRPLYFGDTVHVETTCVSREFSGRRSGKVAWRRKLFNERGEVVQSGIFETLVAVRSPINRSHFRGERDNDNIDVVSQNSASDK